MRSLIQLYNKNYSNKHKNFYIFCMKIIRYEKLIAGRYLGEIMRLVIVKLINKKLLFNGEGSEKILKPWQFKTEFITSIQK